MAGELDELTSAVNSLRHFTLRFHSFPEPSHCRRFILIDSPAGVYISVQKRYLSPPPLLKMIFFPLSRHIVFQLPSRLFCLNSSLFYNFFTRLLPLFSFSFPFLNFSFPFLPFSFPFLLFSFTFSPFFSSLFHILSRNDHG